MVDLKQIDEALNKYTRPQTFPLAIRMCERGENLPDKVKIPKSGIGILITVCQGFAMARRYGWTIAIGKEDQVYPHGHVVLGFVPNKGYLDGSIAEKAGVSTKDRFARIAQALSLLEYGKYIYLLVAPIQNTRFEPHLILFYGNPAQIARLVQGATTLSGNALNFVAGAGIGCPVYIVSTILTDECQVLLCGAGDRYFALTQDHEAAFTNPMSKAESTIEGLKIGHKEMGHRYPTPSFLRFEGQLPTQYYKFTGLLLKEK